MDRELKLYKCLIIDDEQNAIDILEHHLKEFRDYQIVETFTDALSAAAFLKTHEVDLVFLDIQMPGLNGIDLLRNLNITASVFLTTAYRHYAPEAFELDVTDYLLKPISVERIRKALLKFEQSLTYTDKNSESSGMITIRSNRSDIHLDTKDIYYLEAMGDYVKCHLNDRVLLTKEPLKSLLDRLPGVQFRQIHRSYVVNSYRIQEESSSEIKILDISLPLSRSYRTK